MDFHILLYFGIVNIFISFTLSFSLFGSCSVTHLLRFVRYYSVFPYFSLHLHSLSGSVMLYHWNTIMLCTGILYFTWTPLHYGIPLHTITGILLHYQNSIELHYSSPITLPEFSYVIECFVRNASHYVIRIPLHYQNSFTLLEFHSITEFHYIAMIPLCYQNSVILPELCYIIRIQFSYLTGILLCYEINYITLHYRITLHY